MAHFVTESPRGMNHPGRELSRDPWPVASRAEFLLQTSGLLKPLVERKLLVTERARPRNRLLVTDASRGLRLLVSVRSSEEALAAIEGGADILDVKEPTRGSLGMANIEIVAAIARQVADDCGSASCSEGAGDLRSGSVRGREARAQQIVSAQHIPLSVALGEVIDWRVRDDVPALPESVTFAKLGLSHLARSGGWRDEWSRVRERFDQRHPTHLEWVAVAYADAEQAASPPIQDILEVAVATNCSGLLIDTFTKTGLTLTDCCDAVSLCELAERCHSAGLFLALAGRLSRESLSKLSRVPADVLAIRSAACEDADRTARVSTRAVASFRNAMQTTAASTTAAFILTPVP